MFSLLLLPPFIHSVSSCPASSRFCRKFVPAARLLSLSPSSFAVLRQTTFTSKSTFVQTLPAPLIINNDTTTTENLPSHLTFKSPQTHIAATTRRREKDATGPSKCANAPAARVRKTPRKTACVDVLCSGNAVDVLVLLLSTPLLLLLPRDLHRITAATSALPVSTARERVSTTREVAAGAAAARDSVHGQSTQRYLGPSKAVGMRDSMCVCVVVRWVEMRSQSKRLRQCGMALRMATTTTTTR